MANRGFWIMGLVLLVVWLVSGSLYIVLQTERAVLLKFGEVVNSDVPPGLHFKFPWVNQVRKFDGRILTFDSPPERFLTLEKKPLDVDFFVKWRITDTEAYYTATTGDEARAHSLLAQRIRTGLRNQFGERTVHEVVSGERDLLMDQLVDSATRAAQAEFGVEVIDIRIKRIDLPERVSQSVFERMRSEREREAREYRATGREQAEVIRAAADRQKTVIEAEAYRDAEIIRGEGDALATAIYAQAYSADAEFYAFMRSLEAYRESFGERGDLMVLDPKGDFFQYFERAQGQAGR